MPALPIDEASKYVAGAYVVFLVLLLIYIAIMAAKLERMRRDLTELADLAEAARRGCLMAEVLVLGVSHKTAPLELRERLALTEGRAVGVLGELVTSGEVAEAAAISTCNRTELYMYASDAGERRVPGAGRARARGRHPADRARLPPLLAARAQRRRRTSSGSPRASSR